MTILPGYTAVLRRSQRALSAAALTPQAESGQWLQSRAMFVSPNGASSAQLEEVRIEFG
ncbi:MAG: hypothetical protein ACKJSG_16075 [Lentisphaeria bacterium]